MSDPDINLAKIELPVSPRDSARIVDALVDLFSPVTEALGVVGDQVRLYRTNSVLRTLAETKRLAQDSGYSLKRPPLHFLVPFLEEASLHDQTENPGLSIMWANMLVAASQEDGATDRLFIDMLSRINSEDARNIERIVRNYRGPRQYFRRLTELMSGYSVANLIANISKDVDGYFSSRVELGDEAITGLANHFIHRAERPGVLVLRCKYFSASGREDREIVHPDFKGARIASLHRLDALNILNYPLAAQKLHPSGGVFSLEVCALTPLGVEFYLNTHDRRMRDAGRELPPFEG